MIGPGELVVPDRIGTRLKSHAYCIDCVGDAAWSVTFAGRDAHAHASSLALAHKALCGGIVRVESYAITAEQYGVAE